MTKNNKTDYIKAFIEAIGKADLKNKNVVRNLDNALVMASARYEGYICVNVEVKHTAVGSAAFEYVNVSNPAFNFSEGDYRLKPEPQYKPFDVESFKPYRDCWFWDKEHRSLVKPIAYDGENITFYFGIDDEVIAISWKEFLDEFTLDGKPAGVGV